MVCEKEKMSYYSRKRCNQEKANLNLSLTICMSFDKNNQYITAPYTRNQKQEKAITIGNVNLAMILKCRLE